MLQPRSTEYHPLLLLAILVALFFAASIVGAIIGIAVGAAVYGLQPLMDLVQAPEAAHIGLLKCIQIFSSLGFILPPLICARIEKQNVSNYFGFRQTIAPATILAAAVLMVCALPLLEFSVQINQKMNLPEALKGIEEWMKMKEEEMKVLTEKLLSMKTAADLAVNLLMIAVLPAIGEELFFRGGVQTAFWRWFKNHHVAIWVTAILFSTIHLQFYGFLPRMLLGAGFGYLYIWSRNIWVPILGHFINNGLVVVVAWIFQKQGKPIDDVENIAPTEWYVYLASALITGSLLWFLYKQSKLQGTDGE